MSVRALLPAVGTLCLCLTSAAGTIYVDASNPNCPGSGTESDPYCKIQDGINGAVDGDTVLVAPGTYKESLDFLGKAITVTSSTGPSATVIDASPLGPGVTFHSGETLLSVIAGFTLTGGGISCRSSSPTIIDNTITVAPSVVGVLCNGASPLIASNTITGTPSPISYGQGSGIVCLSQSSPRIEGNHITSHCNGAILADSSAPTVSDNLIESNSDEAITFTNSSLVIANNTISGNDAGCIPYNPYCGGEGGGIKSRGSYARISENVIRSNGASRGGGVFADRSSLVIDRNLFADNSASCGSGYDNHGGALHLQSSVAVVSRNLMIGNRAQWNGGGAFLQDSKVDMSNNVVTANSADLGGGLSLVNTTVTSINETVAHNAARLGGGVHASSAGTSLTTTNSIFWGDSPNEILSVNGAVSNVTYSDVQGGHPGPGNISLDPLFIDPAHGDWRIGCGSPCLDAGTNSAVQNAEDFEGDGRVVDGDSDGTATVDMGADEFDMLWSANGPAVVGGPLSFRAEAPPAQTGNLAYVFLSLGDGASGGIPVPNSGGRVLRLDPDAVFNALPGHGPSRGFLFRSRAEDRVTVSLSSYDFDASVRVEGEDGELIGESDGGGIATNARLVVEAQANRVYRIFAAVSRGSGAGEFRLAVERGEVLPLEGKELSLAEVARANSPGGVPP